MYVKQKTKIAFLLGGCAVMALATSSGCRTGGFTKPDMGKLAFWKSDSSIFASKTQNVPPPPARQFDPAPFGGALSSDSQLAGTDSQGRYKNDISDMRAEIDEVAKSLDLPTQSPGSGSFSGSPANDFAANLSPQFNSKTNNVQSELNDFGGNVKSKLDGARTSFNSAMNSRSPAGSTDFAAKSKPSHDMTTAQDDNIKVPAGIAGAKFKIDQSLASVNHSLQSANGKLAAGADDFGNRVRSLQESLNSPISKAAGAANEFKTNVNHQLSGLTQPKFGEAQSAAKAEMAAAREEIAELKQQIAAKNSGTSTAFGLGPAGTAPAGRVEQLQTPFNSSINNNDFAAKLASARSDASSSAPSGRFPISPNKTSPSYPLTFHGQFSPRENQNGGNFSPPSFNSGQSIGVQPNQTGATATQVGFQAVGNQSKVITANNEPTTRNSANSIGASKIENFVSEVDIPASILQGSGSYAPGSVNSLRPKQ
ncbi:MAG: hypothetical protein ACI87E_000541 [Mariniblastus sp.]|jgi:hypothetical protein